jgi:hypothetical protein
MATTVTVTWGEQLIAPIQFNNFKIGPFSMTTEIRPGESEEQAMARAYAACAAFARSTYKEKFAAFKEAYQAANAVVGGRAERR